jgi:hypothetical protein
VSCILTQAAAPQWGPLVASPNVIEMNVSGCVAIESDDLDGNGCAGALEAARQCKRTACESVCAPVIDMDSFEAEQRCETAAAADTCAAFEEAARCGEKILAAGLPGATCIKASNSGDFDAMFDDIAPIFCE